MPPTSQPVSGSSGNLTDDSPPTNRRVAETDRWTGQKAGERKIVKLDDIEISLRWCPPGRFTMGSPKNEPKRDLDENQVQVTLTRGFWLMETEVTQQLYQAVTGSNPSRSKSAKNFPVETVSWENAVQFCERLSRRLHLNGQLPNDFKLVLPTEAQWEYACRAGTTTATAFGPSLSSKQANFNGSFPYNGVPKGPNKLSTTRVGSYAANAWGLYDMHGNVWEWCSDWYGEKLKGGRDPVGEVEAVHRVQRGGGWINFGWFCRSANRLGGLETLRYERLGFRATAVRSE